MGRLRANFARLGNPMQDCHLGKEPALRAPLPGHSERKRRILGSVASDRNAGKYRQPGKRAE